LNMCTGSSRKNTPGDQGRHRKIWPLARRHHESAERIMIRNLEK
jgi:hypothetical protein